MIIELHLLQNFAPANLNRDDTGSPKEAIFGDVRRARISSQAFKRAIRREFATLLPKEQLSYRTKRIVELMTARLVTAGRGAGEAAVVSANVLGAAKFKTEKNKSEDLETKYLIFIGDDEVDALVAVAQKHWQALSAKKPDLAVAKKDVLEALNKSASVDLALFGRMLADLPERNVEAACQVAHAISTNKLASEFDYFTAMDDLAGEDESGAAMIESLGFNSSTFYRYLNLDVDALVARLGRDRSREATAIFLEAVSRAIPTGKQNSMAAQNRPDFWLGEVRRVGHVSLANAFLTPARSSREKSLMAASIAALDSYWGRMTALYGAEDTDFVAVAASSPDDLQNLAGKRVPSFADFKERLVNAALPVSSPTTAQ